ncbi:toxin-antitoxin system YwqK family antitoxin [Aggregatibacter kilianii]|uniref:toxin-antitoxin system YwqK family antitoxin n=1 Tax=Aggregatibacter kilianii TaxID=2025884 RepID=UPI0019550EBE|nr:hypothetical protein [Aggregatibacter kilianii]
MMKKWWLVSLTMLVGSGYAADPTYDATKGALQNNPALCGYGYNPNCSSGSYSRGSSSQYTPPPRVDSIQCEALGNGYQRCAHYYDVTRTSLKSVMTLDPNNVVIGEYLNYYDNGRLKNIMRYNDKGLKHGTIVHYWKNGKPKGDIQYQNDLEHGLSHEYDEDGKLFKVWEYNQGHLIHSQEMDGKIKHGKEEFYRTNNKGEDEVYRTQEWENGKLVK